MKTLIVIGLAVALAACVREKTPDLGAIITQEIEAGRASCEAAKHPTRVARARCFNQAEARMGEIVDSDLVNVRFATRVVIAERVDRREMSQSEAELVFAKAMSDLSSQYSNRTTSRQIARAQTLSAISAAQAAEPKSCTFIGNTMRCY